MYFCHFVLDVDLDLIFFSFSFCACCLGDLLSQRQLHTVVSMALVGRDLFVLWIMLLLQVSSANVCVWLIIFATDLLCENTFVSLKPRKQTFRPCRRPVGVVSCFPYIYLFVAAHHWIKIDHHRYIFFYQFKWIEPYFIHFSVHTLNLKVRYIAGKVHSC